MPHSVQVVVALCALLCACDGAGDTAKRPNILVAVVDTLRRDHVDAEPNTTPTVDVLASEGVRFDAVHTLPPWTPPSAASILAGLYPSMYGVGKPRVEPSDDDVTLPEFTGEGLPKLATEPGQALVVGYAEAQRGAITARELKLTEGQIEALPCLGYASSENPK